MDVSAIGIVLETSWLTLPLLMAPGHVGLVLLLYAPFAYLLCRRGRRRRALVVAAALAALATSPDVDLYVAALDHRGLTHTLWAALAVGGLLAAVGLASGSLVGDGSYALAALGFRVGAFAVVAHLLGDVVTPMGIRPLAPVHRGEYTFDLVLSRNAQVNGGLLIGGLVASVLAMGNARPYGGATPADE